MVTQRRVRRLGRPQGPFAAQPVREVPPSWFTGSWPEYVAHETLVRLGYRPGLDFHFQSARQGGRAFLGGLVIDFFFHRPPGLAVNVNSRYYHYNRAGSGRIGVDRFQRTQMAGLGYTLIFIDDDDLLKDPEYYVTEALRFRDHSELRL